MWENLPGHLLVISYCGVLALVAMYGLHRYVLLYLYIKHRRNVPEPRSIYAETSLPRVTVQLPMYNEDVVAERVIRAACQIDYPLDKLDIQVLDDSTDHSADTARRAVESWAAKGYPVKYVHRTDRTGYKAGALEAGMPSCAGELIAIFDADFVPPRDILRNVVNHFTDDRVGMVQVRWDHLNRDASMLTRTQAIFLDGHFVIEHTARNRSGRFMHFNGTAGVWRRETIADAGGWQHDTLTEDLDLSYRAQLKGWKFVYLPQISAPAELPPEMIAFKQQAHRWTKGSFQTAIKLLPQILLDKKLSYRVKSEAFFHLTNTLVYPLMVLLTLLMYPTFFNIFSPFSSQTAGHYVFSASLFVLATCSAGMFFAFGQRELFGREAGWKTLLYMPLLMALGVGISINNSRAVLGAIWSSIRGKPSEFIRTPKYGVTGLDRGRTRREPRFKWGSVLQPIVEVSFGIYMSICVWMSLTLYYYWGGDKTGLASVPFLAIFAGGYLYVGFSSLWVLYKQHQNVNDDLTQTQAETASV